MLTDTQHSTGCPPFAQKGMTCPQMSASPPGLPLRYILGDPDPNTANALGGEEELGCTSHGSVKIGVERKAWLRARWASKSPPATKEMKAHTFIHPLPTPETRVSSWTPPSTGV